MKLIKNIGIQTWVGSTGRKESATFGLFECPSCKKHVEKKLSKGKIAKSCGEAKCRKDTFNFNKSSTLANIKDDPVHKKPYYSTMKEAYRRIRKTHKVCDDWNTPEKFIRGTYSEYCEIRALVSKVTFTNESDTISPDTFNWIPVSPYAIYGKLTDSLPNYVYLVQVNEYVKIGVTKRLSDRMETFRTSNPYEVKILDAIPTADAYKAEKELHEMFKEKSMRGEWFKLSDTDVQTVAHYLRNYSISND